MARMPCSLLLFVFTLLTANAAAAAANLRRREIELHVPRVSTDRSSQRRR